MTDDLSQKEILKLPIKSSVFVTAPPGFGKTYLMTERISLVLSKNVIRPPNKILALTFSNAAANELKDRVSARIREPEKCIDVMTFHTLAFFLLKVYGPLVGVKRNFLIVDENKINEFKKDFFQKYLTLTNSPAKDDKNELFHLVQNYDDWYKNKFVQMRDEKYPNPELFYQLKKKIQTEFINDENLTFDFLLFKAIELLKMKPDLKEIYYKKYPLIFADEFQDTNYLQYMFLKEITTSVDSRKRPVFVVGDKKQAIMKFQGANPENIEYLIEDFNCIKKELKKNHRTNSPLVLALTNKLRNPIDVIPSDIKCKMYFHRTVKDEIERLVNVITELKCDGTQMQDICILVPQRSTATPIKNAFKERSIEFCMINEFKFDYISENYPKLLAEFEKRIRTKTNRASVSRVLSFALKKFYAESMDDDPVLKYLEKFAFKFDSIAYKSKEVWERIQQYYNFLQMEIDWVKLIKQECKNKILISSIHGAKGLEYPHVCMVGIVNYRLPHTSICGPCSFDRVSNIDTSEGEDLLYVGISRATTDLSFFYSLEDEQTCKRRKISCVFTPILGAISFIDSQNNEYAYNNREIAPYICSKN